MATCHYNVTGTSTIQSKKRTCGISTVLCTGRLVGTCRCNRQVPIKIALVVLSPFNAANLSVYCPCGRSTISNDFLRTLLAHRQPCRSIALGSPRSPFSPFRMVGIGQTITTGPSTTSSATTIFRRPPRCSTCVWRPTESGASRTWRHVERLNRSATVSR